jgi:hypothetical protein
VLRARSHKGSWRPGPQQDCTSALRRSGLTAWPDAAKQPASTHSVARQAGRQVGRLAGTSGSGKEELSAPLERVRGQKERCFTPRACEVLMKAAISRAKTSPEGGVA